MLRALAPGVQQVSEVISLRLRTALLNLDNTRLWVRPVSLR